MFLLSSFGSNADKLLLVTKYKAHHTPQILSYHFHKYILAYAVNRTFVLLVVIAVCSASIVIANVVFRPVVVQLVAKIGAYSDSGE